MTGRCTTRVRAKGPSARFPESPPLRQGFGAIIGTLADSGGALPHYPIIASTPGDAPNAPHASATADSIGGFVLNGLPPGRYKLLVRALGHLPDSRELEVTAGRVDTVRLSLQILDCAFSP
ncbi:MAG: hypothetical protein NVSMB53_08560 [Gemmatimonadaceae bacterium]